MKKTVTTILSLALAMILVSSLGSGVILAKTVKVHHVVILDCGPDEFVELPLGTLAVTGFTSNTDDDFGFLLPDPGVFPTTCVEGTAAILEAGFKVVNSAGGFNHELVTGVPGSGGMFSRYMFLKTTKVRVPK